jgi:hypothetical protein
VPADGWYALDDDRRRHVQAVARLAPGNSTVRSRPSGPSASTHPRPPCASSGRLPGTKAKRPPLPTSGEPGATRKGDLVAANPLPRAERLTVALEGRGIVPAQSWELEVPGRGGVRRDFERRLPQRMKPGRHRFALRVSAPDGADGSDAFLAVDVDP